MDNTIVNKEVLEVIRENYINSFPAERRILDYAMKYPKKVINYNVAELAHASGTSSATVIRIIRSLGYDGYNQFRLTLARDLGKREKIDYLVSDTSPVIDFYKEYTQSIIEMSQHIDNVSFKKIISIIKNASCVHMIATGNTANISQYMGFRLERISIKSTYHSEVIYCINKINNADPDDIVIAISKSGESKSVNAGVRFAKEKGLIVIAITAFNNSALAKNADYVLLSSSHTQSYKYKTYSYFQELAIVDALISFIINDELLINKYNKNN